VLGTLHERMGGDAQMLGSGDDGSYEGTPDGAWARIVGFWGHRSGDPRGIYGGEPEFDYDFGAAQGGLDLYRREGADGSRDNAGLYAAFGHGDIDVTHNLLGLIFKAGEGKFDAWSIGGYWTHFGPSDWYVDAVVQGTWYDASMSGARGLREGDTTGTGFAASLEGGYPFHFGESWVIEPQAQLVYQVLDFDEFNDGAADVRFSDLDSLAGRIGARLARSWSLEEEAQGDGPGRACLPSPDATPRFGCAPTSGTNSWESRRPSFPRPTALFHSRRTSRAAGSRSGSAARMISPRIQRSTPT